MNKKLLFSLSSLVATAVPVAAVVSCGSTNTADKAEKTTETKPKTPANTPAATPVAPTPDPYNVPTTTEYGSTSTTSVIYAGGRTLPAVEGAFEYLEQLSKARQQAIADQNIMELFRRHHTMVAEFKSLSLTIGGLTFNKDHELEFNPNSKADPKLEMQVANVAAKYNAEYPIIEQEYKNAKTINELTIAWNKYVSLKTFMNTELTKLIGQFIVQEGVTPENIDTDIKEQNITEIPLPEHFITDIPKPESMIVPGFRPVGTMPPIPNGPQLTNPQMDAHIQTTDGHIEAIKPEV